MTTHTQPHDSHERRQSIRLAGGAMIDAVVLDDAQRPVQVLDEAKVLNVSAGGMAVATRTSAEPGRMIRVTVPASRGLEAIHLRLKAVDSRCDAIGRTTLRCQLVEGRIPARLIYQW